MSKDQASGVGAPVPAESINAARSDPGAPPAEDIPAEPAGRRWKPWMTWLTAIAVVALVVVVVGRQVRLPYYTIEPGSSVDLLGDVDEGSPRISVEGAPTYPTDGEIMLLFVRESARVNLWEWIRASLDPDIDLFREQEFTGGRDPEDVRVESEAEMARSQLAATRLALEAAGYEVPVGEGVVVLAVAPSRPAADVLEPGDVLLAIDGTVIERPTQVGELVQQHDPGDTLEVRLRRANEERTVEVPVVVGDDGRPIVGVYVSGRYDFPVDVAIDTSRIGGPSAGLAMSLSVLDTLTPGDLTGGKKIAVTGTISEDGAVGEIGGISQKAISARGSGADLFIVPACTREEIEAECERDLARAEDRAGDLRVVPVATFDEALEVLEENGAAAVEVPDLAA
jgi:PDZ domain-containing protein